MFLYKQVPAERLSGLSRFSLMGKPLLGLILITRIRASHGSCNHPDGLSPFITCECILFKTDTGVYE